MWLGHQLEKTADLVSGNGLSYGTWALPSSSLLLGDWVAVPTVMIFSHPHPLLSNSSFLPFICFQNPPALVWELIKDPKLLGKDISLHSSSAPPLTFHGCEQKGTVCISPLYGMRIGGQFGEDVGAHRENIHKPQGNCASIVFFSLGTHTILYPRLCSSFPLKLSTNQWNCHDKDTECI